MLAQGILTSHPICDFFCGGIVYFFTFLME